MKKIGVTLFFACVSLTYANITDQTVRHRAFLGTSASSNVLVLKPTTINGPVKTDWCCSKTSDDGTLFLGGTCNNRFALGIVRSTDTFSGTVLVFPSFAPGSKEKCTAMAIDGNGNIVLAGNSTIKAGTNYFAVARATANGKIDTSFAPNGIKRIEVSVAGGINDQCKNVNIDNQGNIILSGTSMDVMANSYFSVIKVPSF